MLGHIAAQILSCYFIVHNQDSDRARPGWGTLLFSVNFQFDPPVQIGSKACTR